MARRAVTGALAAAVVLVVIAADASGFPKLRRVAQGLFMTSSGDLVYVDTNRLTAPEPATSSEVLEADPAEPLDPSAVAAAVAACESGTNWTEGPDTGLCCFTGAYQFKQATWESYGGLEFAPAPYLASPAEQTVMFERLAFTGWGGVGPQGPPAWPNCWPGS